jgi:pantothenate kinase type III
VVTVGTAITVNLVTPASMDVSSRSRVEILQSRENRRPSFQGGAILPGYQAFLRSLSAAAPTLAPAIQEILAHPDWTTDGFEDLHPTLAGATTPGNLRRGALEGVAGAVAQNLASVESEVGVEPGTLAVWITGGDADALHSGLRRMTGVNRRIDVVSDLVLEGLGLTLDWLLSPARDA